MYKKFTIIICCYNSGERIERVINTILMQKDYINLVEEILVVDNNSKDNTSLYINKCIEKTSNIRMLFEENQGLSNARRLGIENCKTEWVIFIDDDNFMAPDWIKNANRYIEDNINIGAFNGGVVPKIQEIIDEDSIKRLEASLKSLACTHLKSNEIKLCKKNPFRVPIGAGLVIRTKPLKKLSSEGWLSVLGRKGEKLSSGEDGEMTLYVKNKGYKFGFCNEMLLEHEIPTKRLSDEYLNCLWREMGIGVFNAIDTQNLKEIKKLAYLIVIYMRLFNRKFIYKDNKYKYKYYKMFLEGYKSKF